MKKDEKINLLFDTSLAMFKEKGYDQVRVDDICKAANISKPTFYACDLTKEDLLNHAY